MDEQELKAFAGRMFNAAMGLHKHAQEAEEWAGACARIGGAW